MTSEQTPRINNDESVKVPKAKADALAVVIAIAAEASRTQDLAHLLTFALGEIIELTGMEGGAALLIDEDTQLMHLAAERNFPQGAKDLVQQDPLHVGQSIPGIAAQRCELLIVEDSREDERELPPFRELGVRTHVCIPLAVRGKALGVLGLMDRRSLSFSTSERELFNAVGEQLGIAVERARAFEGQATLAARLERSNRELEAANKHKTEFLASLSHELRTPLNAILGASELLGEGLFGPLNEKQAEYANDIHESGTHLLNLINDILDISKIEAGKLELRLSRFDVRPLMENSASIVRERAVTKGVQFHVTPPTDRLVIEADERKVKQVVYNLLSNAMKFTPENGSVNFSARRDGEEVVFVVEDTGPGVAKELGERIFEEFFQASGSEEGTGLGLALSRRLVELHAGRIWLDGDSGRGSRFLFAIPVTQTARSDSDDAGVA